MNASNSASSNHVPVGLFGFAIKINLVLSLIAAAIASRSCEKHFAGTSIASALIACVTRPYTANACWLYTTESCSETKARAKISRRSFEPLPNVIRSCAIPNCFSTWSFKIKPPPSGYRPISASSAATASFTLSEQPNGFSFDASFTISVIPNSRSSSLIGLPGW